MRPTCNIYGSQSAFVLLARVSFGLYQRHTTLYSLTLGKWKFSDTWLEKKLNSGLSWCCDKRLHSFIMVLKSLEFDLVKPVETLTMAKHTLQVFRQRADNVSIRLRHLSKVVLQTPALFVSQPFLACDPFKIIIKKLHLQPLNRVWTSDSFEYIISGLKKVKLSNISRRKLEIRNSNLWSGPFSFLPANYPTKLSGDWESPLINVWLSFIYTVYT